MSYDDLIDRTCKCEECDGTGNFYRRDEDGDYLPCDFCEGAGEVKCRKQRHLSARIDPPSPATDAPVAHQPPPPRPGQ